MREADNDRHEMTRHKKGAAADQKARTVTRWRGSNRGSFFVGFGEETFACRRVWSMPLRRDVAEVGRCCPLFYFCFFLRIPFANLDISNTPEISQIRDRRLDTTRALAVRYKPCSFYPALGSGPPCVCLIVNYWFRFLTGGGKHLPCGARLNTHIS